MSLKVVHPVWGEGLIIDSFDGCTMFSFADGLFKIQEPGSSAELIVRRKVKVVDQ